MLFRANGGFVVDVLVVLGFELEPKQGHRILPSPFPEPVFLVFLPYKFNGLFFSTYSLMSLYHYEILNLRFIELPSSSNISQHISRCFRLESCAISAKIL